MQCSLSSLPTPKNDYQIVVPQEDVNEEEEMSAMLDVIEDQADIDARTQQELIEERKHIFIISAFKEKSRNNANRKTLFFRKKRIG